MRGPDILLQDLFCIVVLFPDMADLSMKRLIIVFQLGEF